MTAYAGIGPPLLPLVVVAILVSHDEDRWKKAIVLFSITAMVVAMSHLAWFDDWRLAYERRSERMTALHPYHQSAFIILDAFGLYHPSLPILASAALAIAGYLKYALGTPLHPALAIVYFATLGLGPDSSYDRILAAFFPALILLANRHTFFMVILILLSAVNYRFFSLENVPPQIMMSAWLPVILGIGGLLLQDAQTNWRTARERLFRRR